MVELSTTRIAIVAIIIVVVVAAVFLVQSPRMSQSGISSIQGSTAGLAGSTASVSSVNAGLCSTPPCAPPISGWLHTKPGDTQLYDSSGNAVRLVGVNVMGLAMLVRYRDLSCRCVQVRLGRRGRGWLFNS